MEKIILNETLALTFPDGFRKLDEAELSQMKTVQSGSGICLRNDDQHIIVSLGYRRAGLLSAFFSDKDLIKSAQGRIAAVMRRYSYQLGAYDRCCISDKTAHFFTYGYVAQNIRMAAECCAIREAKTIYYLHFYVRESSRDTGFSLWRGILANAQWKR